MTQRIYKSGLNPWAIIVTLLLAVLACITVSAQTPRDWKAMKGHVNLFLASDMGRNGYYDQRPIADLMGQMAESIGPDAILAAGDIHHFNGVASTADPLWLTNYETIYSHPELMIDWFPALGNHEYRGNTQAVLDYSHISRRWMSGERYYSRVFADKRHNVSVRIIMLDTTPLISRYRDTPETYPDACRQHPDRQLAWLDSTLSAAREQWVIVVGHHPIYAQTPKAEHERTDMQQTLLPVLRRHPNVSMYVCGHIHNFQHIRHEGDAIDYVVNSSASLARKVKATTGTLFCSPEPGFSVISATAESLRLYMVDKNGTVLHMVER